MKLTTVTLASVVLAANAVSMLWFLNSGSGPGDFLSVGSEPLTLRSALFHLAVGAVLTGIVPVIQFRAAEEALPGVAMAVGAGIAIGRAWRSVPDSQI